MRNRAVLLLASAGLLLFSGCVNLDEVAALHSVADAAREALPRVSDDFYGSCQRRAAIVARIPADELPPNLRNVTPDCKPYKALAAHLAADSAVLTDYLDALSKLASNEPLSYGAAIDTDIATVTGLTAASGANVDVAADAQKASIAALTITQKLAEVATRHYRERKVTQLILDADPSVQTLTAALNTVAVTDYGLMLDSERNFVNAYYQGPMAAQTTERLALILVQRQYDTDVLALDARRDAAADYGAVMTRIATLHGKLATAAREPSSFMEKVKSLAPDIADLKSAVTALQTGVK